MLLERMLLEHKFLEHLLLDHMLLGQMLLEHKLLEQRIDFSNFWCIENVSTFYVIEMNVVRENVVRTSVIWKILTNTVMLVQMLLNMCSYNIKQMSKQMLF